VSADDLINREGFTRTPVQYEDPHRVLIESACPQCGASKIASAADGSIQQWEMNHTCEKKPQAVPPSRLAG